LQARFAATLVGRHDYSRPISREIGQAGTTRAVAAAEPP